MPWPRSLYVGIVLLVFGAPGSVNTEGNVGCLFSERLCLEDEWCFDDYAFGRCLPPASDVNEDDLYRYQLEREVLHEISRELRRLFTLGYRWSHGYTQCRLQAMLYATKNDVIFDDIACSHLADQDLEGALKALEGQDLLDPQEVAIIKYTPSVENPHANFADEVFYPPTQNDNRQTLRDKILSPDAIDVYEMKDPYANLVKRSWIPQMHRRSPSYFTNPYNTPNDFRAGYETRDNDYYRQQLSEILQQLESSDEASQATDDFSLNYNTPDNFRAGWESRDFPESRIYFDEEETPEGDEHEQEENGSGYNRDEIFRELQPKNRNRAYTEGGIVYAPQNDDLTELFRKFNLGFKRPERLDVKKPGPRFQEHLVEDSKRAVPRPRLFSPDYLVDTDFVNVEFENNVHTWAQGKQLINNISHILGLEPTVFTHGRVDHNEVTFKVGPNSKGWNSSDVAREIGLIKKQVLEATGIVINSTGIGDKTKIRTVVLEAPELDNDLNMIIFLVCGITVATLIAAIVLLLIKRHLKLKDKLQGISRGDTEASKDYQDLCRVRMATKNQQAGETVHGRITSLSRESEQSPSSRSSTSSWSEEPALHNMDISTGHMVLSYMEDHLKNKDRLEQEWVALCAYVAEPCEMTVALRKENIDKNRGDIIPYDHSRVVLNELSNATNSDYVNASSITDHDPRNPAYIATQGPLPLTAPDFWQLIWEQGAVVIVMLTRLTESGTAMCHRYWPEEGSELYHIYEVHLVSEHIWCDDYLVRSFYLKNIKTGETRTVTQFHFLSWPESGVPASTKALLEFRRKVNKSYRGRSCPIVVHCSDGAGRTGTYCLIDMVLSRMAKGAKEIDIAATLEHLRDQRVKMVANKQQFEFVLTAVAEEVHAILKALPPSHDGKENK